MIAIKSDGLRTAATVPALASPSVYDFSKLQKFRVSLGPLFPADGRLHARKIAVLCRRRSAVTCEFEHPGVFPLPALNMAIGKGHDTAAIVAGGWPIPPGPVACGIDAQTAVIDAVLVFIP